MKPQKHTSGPWHLIETKNLRNPELSCYLLANKNPYIHGTLDGVIPQDAALIAAAPEMLEALERVFRGLPANYDGPMMEQVESVIKKAKGL